MSVWIDLDLDEDDKDSTVKGTRGKSQKIQNEYTNQTWTNWTEPK